MANNAVQNNQLDVYTRTTTRIRQAHPAALRAMSNDTSQNLLQRVRAGDDAAATELFDRYLSRLIGLAKKRLSPMLARRVDPEDVVQSAYRSFFAGAQEGRFELSRSGDLWRLLAAITLNKLRTQAKRHTAKKRTVTNEQSLAANSSLMGVSPEQIDREPGPDEAVALAEQLERTMRGLKPIERQMLELRLQSYTIDEIADQVERSERTVRRLLERLKEQLITQLAEHSL